MMVNSQMLDVHDYYITRILWIIIPMICHYAWNSDFPCNMLATILVIWMTLMAISKKRRKYIRMIWRDIRKLKVMMKNQSTITKQFMATSRRFPNRVMIFFEDEEWTYQKVDEYSNQIANYFASKGLCEGDNVALLMETRVQYVPIFLGFLKIGVTVSLINNNLTKSSLLHCVRTTSPKAIIYGQEIEKALSEITDELSGIELYLFPTDSDEKLACPRSINFVKDLREVSTKPPPPTRNVKITSKALYIFTSGTTGLPKAAVITHLRYITMVHLLNIFCKMQTDDRLYVALPLHHTNGAITSAGQAILNGLPIALRKKFSVKDFWADCLRHKCTGFVYIGELCRYLLAAPPSPQDDQHNIRFMLGNGLRQTIWEPFVKRFNIQQVAELYGSSEGIGNLVNTENKVGAVGCLPFLWPKLFPAYLVEIDPVTEMPKRDAKGRCIKISKPGVPGMYISMIVDDRPGNIFDGYKDNTSTSKKIISDVFTEGDRFYVSGDTFIMDDETFLYFHDRTGDTFRWKGENVATAEVEQVIQDIISLKDAAVYGVDIPGVEGKAGMVAVYDENNSIDLEMLDKELTERLPKYAKPIFVRFLKHAYLTDTYKLLKKQLKDEAYNPTVVKDRLYFYIQEDKKYIPLTVDLYNKIVSAQIKF